MFKSSTRRGGGGLAAALALGVCCLGLSGCAPRAIGRSLPRHINKVFVPIFDSQAFESGLEEQVTHFVVDEFLKDGRVTPVSRGQADLVLEGFLTEWTETVADLDRDQFELSREVTARCRVYAYSPEDTLKLRPIYVWNDIEAVSTFITDPRLTVETQPQDGKRIVLQALAGEIVREVMEGEPATGLAAEEFDKRLDDPGPRYRPVESLRERRLKKRGQAPLRVAF